MTTLDKSKILSFRQCSKKLWLEVNSPELNVNSTQTNASLQIGQSVGQMVRKIYDRENCGVKIEITHGEVKAALADTQRALSKNCAVFEAGFSSNGTNIFVDVLLPMQVNDSQFWKIVEVKSSSGMKQHFLDDVAIQTFVAKGSGLPVKSISLAHISSDWVYGGDGNYVGFLKEIDLTEAAISRAGEVSNWIDQACLTLSLENQPRVSTGTQCNSPVSCGFIGHCRGQESPQAEFPVEWLPRISSSNIERLAMQGIVDMRHVPDEILNDKQRLVKQHTISNSIFFDNKGAKSDLASYNLPIYFLDFESIQFAIPIWAGWKPYQQAVFQFSIHSLDFTGKLTHQEYLNLSGDDPTVQLAREMVEKCGLSGPIFVYNAGFERTRIQEMIDRLALDVGLVAGLTNIVDRIVDLLPIARNRYYHPNQQGSWSLKDVLPALVPTLSYSLLDGVRNGSAAQKAYLEAIHLQSESNRKAIIKNELLNYCKSDTYATVLIWRIFSGRTDIVIPAFSVDS